jgi:flagellar basal-body rod protein FlgC
MRVFSNFEISASGLSAERLRLDVVANNIANAETTRTAEGGPYRRQMVVFEPRREQLQFMLPASLQALGGMRNPFGESDGADAPDATAALGGGSGLGQGVRVVSVIADQGPGRLVYEPGHPDADAKGYVAMPNVSLINEMVDMMSASRAYQANISAIESAKSMAQQAINIVGQSSAF